MVTYLGHLDYVPNLMTTLIRAFNVLALSRQVKMKLQIRVKLGISFKQTYEGKSIRFG